MWGRFWKQKKILKPLEPRIEVFEIFSSPRNKFGRLLQLRQPASGLHIRDFEVIPEMTIGVFMIVTLGKVSEFLTKSRPACIVFAWGTITVTPPITKGLSNLPEPRRIGKDSPPLHP